METETIESMESIPVEPSVTQEDLDAALVALDQRPQLIKALLAQRIELTTRYQANMVELNAKLKRLGYKATRAPRRKKQKLQQQQQQVPATQN